MTEEQAYDVLAEYPDFELRRYPDHLVAEIEVGGAFELAGNLAFPRLARYIGGHNRSSRKVAMTAPVVQQQAPDSRRYVVGFVMPADVSAEDLPDPSDSAVRTRRVPAETAAALRFSGRWSRSTYEKRTAQLLAALKRPAWTWSVTLATHVSTRRGHRGSCGGTRSSSRWAPGPGRSPGKGGA